MRHMAPIASLIVAALAVAACQTEGGPPSTADTKGGPPSTADITDQQAFAAARAAVFAGLKDPDSAKFGTTFTRKTVSDGKALVFRLRFYTVDQRTDLVCGTVNSKNSFGGYVGMAVFAYRVSRKDVFIDEGPGGERLGSIWCVDSSPA